MDEFERELGAEGVGVEASGEFDEEVVSSGEQTIVPGNEEFTLKYLGSEVAVDRGKAIELAQKGMDYDRIRKRYERLKTTALREGADPAGIKRTDDIDGFLEDYPEVKPSEIPAEVWEAVRAGRSLSEAYMKWENNRLRDESESVRQNRAMNGVSTGSRDSGGVPNALDEFARELRS
jgi:hypothetical protein